jgi:hypothetical protein
MRLRRGGGYLVFPSLSYCARNAHKSLTSFSFLMPANAILVPGILAFGSLMFLELGLVPGDAGILVGVGVGKIRRGAGLAAV